MWGVLAVEDSQLRAAPRTGLRSSDDYAAVGKPQIGWDAPAARARLTDSSADRLPGLAMGSRCSRCPKAVSRRARRVGRAGRGAAAATVLGQDLQTGEDGSHAERQRRACGCPKLCTQPVACPFVCYRWPGMIRWWRCD
jgi:hypothetical protein